MKRPIIFAVIVAYCCFTACSTKPEKDLEEAAVESKTLPDAEITLSPDQMKSAGVALGSPQLRTMQQTLSLTGKITAGPESNAIISVPMGGTVQQILVHPTNAVRKGQVLAILAHPEYLKLQETYLASLQSIRFLEKEYQRQQELLREKAGVEKTLQRAESDFRAEQAHISSLEGQLRLLGIDYEAVAKKNSVQPTISLVSPIDGKVERISAQIGGYLQPGAEAFSVVSSQHLHTELMVYERDLGKIRAGLQFSFATVNAPEKMYQAKIFGMGSMIDPATKTVSIHAEIQGKPADLVAGMMVNARVAVGEVKVMTVPESALVQAGDGYLVFQHRGADAKGNALFMPIPVKTGVSAGGYTEIIFETPQATSPTIAEKSAFFIHAQKAISEGGEE